MKPFLIKGGGSSEAMMLEPLLTKLQNLGVVVHGQRGRKSRSWPLAAGKAWALGALVDGPRGGTILLAPAHAEFLRLQSAWPKRPLIVAESLDSEVASQAGARYMLPRIVDDYFYPPGKGADTFGVTRRLHLEERPRLVYLGGYEDGRVLTAALQLVNRLLTRQGELVLVGGVPYRAHLAPVVKHLKVVDKVIFAPVLTTGEMAGLLLGSDVILVMDDVGRHRAELTWAMASGTPIVARHSRANEAILGPSALFTYDSSVDVWENAVKEALTREAVREELTRRQLEASTPWRASESLSSWVDYFLSALS